MRVLILGATGLVGAQALRRASAEARVTAVIAPTRRPLPPTPKLENPTAEALEALAGQAAGWKADACICCLGTTRAKAGSAEAFQRIDRDLPLAFAKALRAAGVPTFALTSAMNASASSRLLYSRTKGEMEEAIGALGFPSLLIVRPGLLGGDRQESRPLERISLAILGALNPLLPRVARISQASRVAEVLLGGCLEPRPGTRTVGAAALAAPSTTAW